jgi:hypothetical protein
MKKKFVLAAFVALIKIFSAQAYAGFGAQIGLNSGKPFFPFASATFRTTKSPWVFSADLNLKDADFYLQANADDWFVNRYIVYPLSFYVFWGISGGTKIDDGWRISTGARLGAGFDLFVLHDVLEFYLQGAWNPDIGMEKNDGMEFYFKPLRFPVAAGFRCFIK